jgi:REP-associated tyrosine transposase
VPRPLRVEIPGGIYHVVARGNERKAVFRDDEDREAYLGRLAGCSERFRFRLIAYCLMDNHVHVALERGRVALSQVMRTQQSGYAQKFNRRHGRVGHLFQGRYKAFLVQDEVHLMTLVRYIHLNPVVAGIVDRPDAYRWSSDRHYREPGGPAWLAVDLVLNRLASDPASARLAYGRLMASREDQTYEDVPTYRDAIRGERRFADSVLCASGEKPLMPRWTAEGVARSIADAEGLSLSGLRKPGKARNDSRARLIAAYLGKREAGISTAAMARCLGREESSFTRGVRRLEAAMDRDPALRARVESLAAALHSPNTGMHD